MAQDHDDDRIRRKAHEIWESEGRPHGREQQHWDAAKEIIALKDSMGKTLLPRDTGAEEPEEPIQSVEPYGDMPNLTDQGQHDLTDTAREPEITKPSRAVYSIGDTAGGVARPAQERTPDMDDPETVTPPPKVAAVTPTPSNPTLGTPAPRPAKANAPKTSPKTSPNTSGAPVGQSAPVTGKTVPKSTEKPSAVTRMPGKPPGKR